MDWLNLTQDILAKAAELLKTTADMAYVILSKQAKVELVKNIFVIAIMVGVMIGFGIIVKKVYNKYKNYEDRYDEDFWVVMLGLTGVCSTVLSIFLFIEVISRVNILIQLWICPEMWIIEYITKLVTQ